MAFKRKAFISYSHSDEKLATWIQEKLEAFIVPKEIAKEFGSRSLGKMFRDRVDLAAAGDLGTEIRKALEESEYLILLCSPKSAESEYVREEIRYFKSLGRTHSILAAIIDGEPHASARRDVDNAEECFPPHLLNKVDGNGNMTLEPEDTEPLAADFRADKDGKENGLLKIISGLLKVDLDDLIERQKQAERRRRNRSNLIALTMTALFAASLIAGGIALNLRNIAERDRELAETAQARAEKSEQLQKIARNSADKNRDLAEQRQAEAQQREKEALEALASSLSANCNYNCKTIRALSAQQDGKGVLRILGTSDPQRQSALVRYNINNIPTAKEFLQSGEIVTAIDSRHETTLPLVWVGENASYGETISYAWKTILHHGGKIPWQGGEDHISSSIRTSDEGFLLPFLFSNCVEYNPTSECTSVFYNGQHFHQLTDDHSIRGKAYEEGSYFYYDETSQTLTVILKDVVLKYRSQNNHLDWSETVLKSELGEDEIQRLALIQRCNDHELTGGIALGAPDQEEQFCPAEMNVLNGGEFVMDRSVNLIGDYNLANLYSDYQNSQFSFPETNKWIDTKPPLDKTYEDEDLCLNGWLKQGAVLCSSQNARSTTKQGTPLKETEKTAIKGTCRREYNHALSLRPDDEVKTYLLEDVDAVGRQLELLADYITTDGDLTAVYQGDTGFGARFAVVVDRDGDIDCKVYRASDYEHGYNSSNVDSIILDGSFIYPVREIKNDDWLIYFPLEQRGILRIRGDDFHGAINNNLSSGELEGNCISNYENESILCFNETHMSFYKISETDEKNILKLDRTRRCYIGNDVAISVDDMTILKILPNGKVIYESKWGDRSALGLYDLTTCSNDTVIQIERDSSILYRSNEIWTVRDNVVKIYDANNGVMAVNSRFPLPNIQKISDHPNGLMFGYGNEWRQLNAVPSEDIIIEFNKRFSTFKEPELERFLTEASPAQ